MIDLAKDAFWFLFGASIWVLMISVVICIIVLVAMFPIPAIALMLFYWLFVRKPR